MADCKMIYSWFDWDNIWDPWLTTRGLGWLIFDSDDDDDDGDGDF